MTIIMLYVPRFIELVELVDNILISNLHYNEYVSWVIFFKLMLLCYCFFVY